jgi:hypothetical protein
MLGLNAILDVLTLVLLALGGYGLFLLRTGTEAAVRTSAEEAAKATIQQLQWPVELARELQKTRGVERQELRFKSYGALWKELRPLAIYDATVINKKVVGNLSSKLSDWYFSEYGGLLLTPQARYFYFALQDLLRATSRFPEEWDADRSVESEGAQKDIFYDDVLTARKADKAISEAISVFDYFSKGTFEDWQNEAPDLGKKWRDGINKVAAGWNELDKRQRFATLQQVGSILRTSLVNDLESRLR